MSKVKSIILTLDDGRKFEAVESKYICGNCDLWEDCPFDTPCDDAIFQFMMDKKFKEVKQ